MTLQMKKQVVVDPFQVMKDLHGPLNDGCLLSWWWLHSMTKVKVVSMDTIHGARSTDQGNRIS